MSKTFSFRIKLQKLYIRMIISSIILITLALTVDCCPTTGDMFWVELGDSCYSISREPMDWGTAQEVGDFYKIGFFKCFIVLLGTRRLPSGDHVCTRGNFVGHFSCRGNNLLAWSLGFCSWRWQLSDNVTLWQFCDRIYLNLQSLSNLLSLLPFSLGERLIGNPLSKSTSMER